MGRIPEEIIRSIRERADIVSLIGRHLQLKQAGRSWKGLCPFHQEKTPSFFVSPERGTYHCFGCDAGGSVYDFLMHQEGLNFYEAVHSLANEVGIKIPENERAGVARGEMEEILRACATAQKFYRAAFESETGAPARAYLLKRGLGLDDAQRYGLGFAPERWDGLCTALSRAKISSAAGERAGLLKQRESGGHYDLLRGRLTFPIEDLRGRVVAFGGRALAAGQEPKYLNTLESPVFRKRETFYGLPHALAAIRSAGRSVLVEGYFDRIALARAGLEETLATCGTAVSEQHAHNLKRRAREVVLLFDGDEAGQRAMLRTLERMLPLGLRVRAAALPEGVDPDDFLKSHGADALRALVEKAPIALELAIARAVQAGTTEAWQRADAVDDVAPLLALLPDAVERGAHAEKLARLAGAGLGAVEQAVRSARKLQQSGGGRVLAADRERAPRRVEITPAGRHYETVLRLLCDHPEKISARECHARVLALAPDADWRALATPLLEALAHGREPAILLDAQATPATAGREPAVQQRAQAFATPAHDKDATREGETNAAPEAALGTTARADALRQSAPPSATPAPEATPGAAARTDALCQSAMPPAAPAPEATPGAAARTDALCQSAMPPAAPAPEAAPGTAARADALRQSAMPPAAPAPEATPGAAARADALRQGAMPPAAPAPEATPGAAARTDALRQGVTPSARPAREGARDTAGRDAASHADAVAGALAWSDAQRARFTALLNAPRADLEAAHAPKIFEDTLDWLARDAEKRKTLERMQKFEKGEVPVQELLGEHQRQLLRARESQQAPRAPAPGVAPGREVL